MKKWGSERWTWPLVPPAGRALVVETGPEPIVRPEPGTGNPRLPEPDREPWPLVFRRPIAETRRPGMAGAEGGMDFSAPFRYALGLRSGYFQLIGIRMVKLTVRERESIQEAVRRFRKLVERSGIKKEMRRREFFEKPSETRRRARLRAERRTKRNRLLGV